MSIPKCLDFENFNQYPTEANPTTDGDMQNFLGNQNKLMQTLSQFMWQPSTSYIKGQIIISGSMNAGLVAVVTTAGQSASSEPTWATAGSVVSDGGVIWTMCSLPTRVSSSGNISSVSVTNGVLSISSKNVANNLTTDVDGYVLDARQGKALKDLIDGLDTNKVSTSTYNTALSLKANLASPALTGTPTAPTPAATDNSTRIATTAFIKGTVKFDVTASQQAQRTTYASSNVYDSSSSSGSGNVTTYTNKFNTIPGVQAGSYTLANLLQRLVNLSHNHKTESSSVSSNCVCNCECPCDCHDGGD